MAEMKSSTSLAELQGVGSPAPAVGATEYDCRDLSPWSRGGSSIMGWMARKYSLSDIVPLRYQKNEGNCFIALDMARRLGMNPLTVMQNLYIVHGNPAWSAKFLIGMFNSNPAFSPIRYEFNDAKPGSDEWGCRAYAIEKATKEKLYGPLITIGLAKAEGWYDKPGSKWKTMPEQMMRYRAAAWLINTTAPEQSMGFRTVEEEEDAIVDITPEAVTTTASIAAAEATRAASAPKADSTVVAEPAAPQESAPAKGKKGAAAKKDAPAQATPAPSAAKEQPTSLLDAKEERIKPETLAAIRADLRRLGVDEDCLPPDLSKEFQTSDPGELDEPDAQRCLALLKTY